MTATLIFNLKLFFQLKFLENESNIMSYYPFYTFLAHISETKLLLRPNPNTERDAELGIEEDKITCFACRLNTGKENQLNRIM